MSRLVFTCSMNNFSNELHFSLTSQCLHFGDSMCVLHRWVCQSLFSKLGIVNWKDTELILGSSLSKIMGWYSLLFYSFSCENVGAFDCRALWGNYKDTLLASWPLKKLFGGLTVPLTLSLQITPLFLKIVVEQLNINV